MSVLYEKQYIAFLLKLEGQICAFAVPIEHIDALVPLDGRLPYAVIPHTFEHVLCVMKPYGKQIPIINLPALFGCTFVPEDAQLLAAIHFCGRMIGIPTKSACLVTAYPNELLSDASTGTQSFIRDNTQYWVLDVPRLYQYIEH